MAGGTRSMENCKSREPHYAILTFLRTENLVKIRNPSTNKFGKNAETMRMPSLSLPENKCQKVLLSWLKRILFELAPSLSLVAEILRRGKTDNETLIAVSTCLSVALICKFPSFPVCVFCSWSARMKRLAPFDLLVRFDSLKETLSVEFSLDLSAEGWLMAYSSELLVKLQKISWFWVVRVSVDVLIRVWWTYCGFLDSFCCDFTCFLRNWRRLFVFFYGEFW